MQREVFASGITKLQEAFNHKLKPETFSLYWERLSLFSDADYGEAIDWTIDNEEKFPRISLLKQRIQTTAMNRREGDQKQREEVASRRRPDSPVTVADVINSIPFPLVLKVVLHKKINGETTQDQLEAAVLSWQKDNPSDKPCRPNCEDGLVYYEKDGTHYVGSCGICMKGNKRFPMVDPDSCLVLR